MIEGIKLVFSKYSNDCSIEELKEKRRGYRQLAIIYGILSIIFWFAVFLIYIYVGLIGLTVWLIFIPISLIIIALNFKTYEGQTSVLLALNGGK